MGKLPTPRERVMALPEWLRVELNYLAFMEPTKDNSFLHNIAVSGEKILKQLGEEKKPMPTDNKKELEEILEVLVSARPHNTTVKEMLSLMHPGLYDKLQSYIAKQVREARIEELKQLPVTQYDDSERYTLGLKGIKLVEYQKIKDRLKELNSKGSTE